MALFCLHIFGTTNSDSLNGSFLFDIWQRTMFIISSSSIWRFCILCILFTEAALPVITYLENNARFLISVIVWSISVSILWKIGISQALKGWCHLLAVVHIFSFSGHFWLFSRALFYNFSHLDLVGGGQYLWVRRNMCMTLSLKTTTRK